MVEIAAGSYRIGCADEVNRDCFDDEKPSRLVELGHYAIMAHEVTAQAYDRCVAEGGCPPAGPAKGCTSQKPERKRHPINCVSWHAARAFCQHRGWRLPTEAEWEVAALGQRHLDFPWGNTPPTCDKAVLASAKGPGCGTGGPLPVGSKPADRSWAGVFDMAGNVREWTASDYAAYPGGKTDPDSHGKVNRGGSFEMRTTGSDADLFTCHTRSVDPPETSRAELGFRCVMLW